MAFTLNSSPAACQPPPPPPRSAMHGAAHLSTTRVRLSSSIARTKKGSTRDPTRLHAPGMGQTRWRVAHSHTSTYLGGQDLVPRECRWSGCRLSSGTTELTGCCNASIWISVTKSSSRATQPRAPMCQCLFFTLTISILMVKVKKQLSMRGCVALLLLLFTELQINALQKPASSVVPLLNLQPLKRHSLGTRSWSSRIC